MRRDLLMVVPVVALALAGTSACATKKFVRTEVGGVNDRVDTLAKSVDEANGRVRRNEARIGDVDKKADGASNAAAAAGKTAADARAVADGAGARAEAAGTKADELDRASRRLVYEVVLSEDQGNFRLGQAALPEAARTRLDELVSQIEADPKAVFFEIEGHTDSTGSKEYNEQLGMARAEAVKKYLYTAHHVPLHKMNVISYGQDKPVAPNATRTGRSQNRRVVVRVLA